MRRRKKTIIALLAIAAGATALLFWPRDHPEARRAFAAVRGLVEVAPNAHFGASVWSAAASNTDAADGLPALKIAPPPILPPTIPTPPIAPPARPIPAGPELAEPEIEIDIVIAKLNLTHARTRLFAESVPSEKLTVGRVASAQAVLGILQPLDVTLMVRQPGLVLLAGQGSRVQTRTSGEVAVLANAAGAPLTYRPVGTKFDVMADITGSGAVKLSIDCELSYVAGRRTVATPQGPAEQPDVKATRAGARAELRSGEALFIGGLAHKAMGRVAFKTPYLAELPGIGSWFCFTREREIEEEVVVLVTPRIVTPR